MSQLNATRPTPVVKPSVSGRYHGVGREDGFEVELRIDVDGPPASQRISADVLDVTTKPATYRGSLRLFALECTEDEDGVMLFAGKGSFTSTTATPWIEVRIPSVDAEKKPRATLSRFDERDGRPGPVYDCEFVSPQLRRVDLTEDYEEDVDRLVIYEDNRDGDRKLSIGSVFEEAGIELCTTREPMVIEKRRAGEDASWSDSELHAVMVDRLGTLTTPEWSVWLLHAFKHARDLYSDGTHKTFGIMFDKFDERQRQGCAIFYRWLGGTEPEQRREQLFACVHEIGHAFNLKHCWTESIVGSARPNARSWLNDPYSYPGGPEAFWSAFEFGFDADEITHLRHAFRNNVIMGGTPFIPTPPLGRGTGLRLNVVPPRELQWGVPVTVRLELMGTGTTPQPVARVLGPRAHSVDILIRGPKHQEFVVFQPLLRHCRADAPTFLRAGESPIRDYAFVHYGQDGFAFDEPGKYELRARYVTPTGTVVLSEVALTELRVPLSQADRDARELLYRRNAGTLMSLVGSSSKTLANGDADLHEFIARHPHHPAAAAARIVLGTNAAREFKRIQPDESVSFAPRKQSAAEELLVDVLDIDRLKRVASKVAADKSVAAEESGTTIGPHSARAHAVKDELARMGTKRDVPAAVDAFIASRRHEIAAEIAGLS